MRPKRDVTQRTTRQKVKQKEKIHPAIDPEVAQTIRMTEVFLTDLGLYEKVNNIPLVYTCGELVNALQGLSRFMVFFLSHSSTNHADTVAKKLGIERMELDHYLLQVVKERLLSLRVEDFYENLITKEAAANNAVNVRPE